MLEKMNSVRHCHVFRGTLTIYIRPFWTCFVQQIRVRITMLHESIDFYRVNRCMRFVSLIFWTYIFSVRPPICASLTRRTLIRCLNLLFFSLRNHLEVKSVRNCRVFGRRSLNIFLCFSLQFRFRA